MTDDALTMIYEITRAAKCIKSLLRAGIAMDAVRPAHLKHI
jgi:hypothetical protein